MSIESNEEAMPTAFARAASKAQEIEALLQETLIAAEVATDTENRSFEDIASEIERLPLGELKRRFLKVACVPDPLRKDRRGFDLISAALPFGRLWYEDASAVVDQAKHGSRSHDAVIRVYDDVGNVIETHERTGGFTEL